jgi:hypothetical protein
MEISFSLVVENLTPNPKPPSVPQRGKLKNTFAPLPLCELCVKQFSAVKIIREFVVIKM